ncbi:hypothetical protein O181_051844 [Austropuccinia psidii MF-1]|uniref:Uncharacterized protein n=1 Tax=Austropuccinia psidii MF-1 TaxID=1389203 RepID=A0A9Q3DZK3_9BASI|nr:hypothetical protein [Austropuccinia psidii MF-1]
MEEFFKNITQLLEKVALVGIVIETPGSIEESLTASSIVSNLSTTYSYTKEILQSQQPLDIPQVIEYIRRRQIDSSESVVIKQEHAFVAQNTHHSNNNKKQNKKEDISLIF